MFASIRKLATATGVVAMLALSTSAQAAQINGSLPLSGFSVTQNGADLGVSTLINALSTVVSSPGLGDYSPVPVLTNFGPHTIDLTNLLSFSLSNATYGSFATTSGVIVQQTKAFLDVFLLGVFTPVAAGLPGLDPTPTSLRISINQSGQSLSEAITMNSPPVSIPEPASALLLGIGLAGAGLSLRRRQRARA